MTNKEIYNTIFSYWEDLCTTVPDSLDKAIWRIDTSNSIYDALLSYTHLCMIEGKEVRM